jgi:hypothetical protein
MVTWAKRDGVKDVYVPSNQIFAALAAVPARWWLLSDFLVVDDLGVASPSILGENPRYELCGGIWQWWLQSHPLVEGIV